MAPKNNTHPAIPASEYTAKTHANARFHFFILSPLLPFFPPYHARVPFVKPAPDVPSTPRPQGGTALRPSSFVLLPPYTLKG